MKKIKGVIIATMFLVSLVVVPVMAGKSMNNNPTSHPTSTSDSVHEGLLRIGISEYGELLYSNFESAGLEYPDGYEHIAVGTWFEGYFVAYENATGDNWAYAMFDERSDSSWGSPYMGFVPVSYNVIEDSATTLRVDVRTETEDGALRLDQEFYMPKDENYVQITMTLRNIGTETITNVVLKRCVDLDTDAGGTNGWSDFDNIFDIDYTRNIVYAYTTATYPYDPRPPGAESHYVGIAGCPTPDYYDVDDWNDYDQRDSPVDFTSYPVFNDYMATQQWNFGTMNSGESKTVSVIYSVGYTLSDLHGCGAPTAAFANPIAAFIPVKNYHLRQVNTCLECITDNLPEDVPEDVQTLLDEMQEHINNANTTGNSIYANNELLKALKCCEDIREKLGITCPL